MIPLFWRVTWKHKCWFPGLPSQPAAVTLVSQFRSQGMAYLRVPTQCQRCWMMFFFLRSKTNISVSWATPANNGADIYQSHPWWYMSWHGHVFQENSSAQVYPSTGWWFGWKSHTNLSQHGSTEGGGWMTSDRVEIRALIFFLFFRCLKLSCLIVPNYIIPNFQDVRVTFLVLPPLCNGFFWYLVIGDFDLCSWIRNQDGAATSFQSSDLATGRHSAESLFPWFRETPKSMITFLHGNDLWYGVAFIVYGKDDPVLCDVSL